MKSADANLRWCACLTRPSRRLPRAPACDNFGLFGVRWSNVISRALELSRLKLSAAAVRTNCSSMQLIQLAHMKIGSGYNTTTASTVVRPVAFSLHVYDTKHDNTIDRATVCSCWAACTCTRLADRGETLHAHCVFIVHTGTDRWWTQHTRLS